MTTRTNISFTDEMYSELKQLSDERGVPLAYIVRESVAAYLERSRIRVRNVHPEWGGSRDDENEKLNQRETGKGRGNSLDEEG